MKNFKNLVIAAVLIVACTLTSCSNKYTPVNELRTLSQDIETNGSNYDVNDWKKAGIKFAKIQKKIVKNKDQYTADESKEIGQLTGQCTRSFASGIVTNVSGKAVSVLNIVKGFVDGVKGKDSEK